MSKEGGKAAPNVTSYVALNPPTLLCRSSSGEPIRQEVGHCYLKKKRRLI
jgi:hypothetical protein